MGVRIFLDANVLFSACYAEGSGLLRLWEFAALRREVELCTSSYAVEEVRVNLTSDRQKSAFDALLERTNVYPLAAAGFTPRPRSHGLPEKDRPILWAAIEARARFLVTGDLRHFGPLMGTVIEGVEVIRPAELLRHLTDADAADEREEGG